MVVWWGLSSIGFLVFVVVWGVLKGGAKYLIKASPPHEVELAAIAGIDAAVLKRFTEAATGLGYLALGDFELSHLQTSAARVYFRAFRAPDGSRILSTRQILRGKLTKCAAWFDTRLQDGRHLVTTNSPDPLVDPELIGVQLPHEWDLQKLLAAHDEKLATLLAGGAIVRPVQHLTELGEILSGDHEQQVARMLKSGMFRREGDYAAPTPKFAMQVIAKMFSPLQPGRSAVQSLGIGGATAAACAAVVASSHIAWAGGIAFGGILGRALGNNGLTWVFATPLLLLPTGDFHLAASAFNWTFLGWLVLQGRKPAGPK